MEAASAPREDEGQFQDFLKLESAESRAGAPQVHWEPCGPEEPSPPSERVCAPRNGLASSQNHPGGERPTGVGAGLQNLGSTCYINAALQCLTYTPPLARYLLSRGPSGACGQQASCTLCALQVHMARALLRPGDVLQPPKALFSGFHRQRQEDAHEFLLFTLDALQRGCLRQNKLPDRASEDSTLIPRIFGGYWRSQITCLCCHSVSDTLDPALDVALDIQAAQSVNQALDLLVRPEQLDGDEAYRCGTCLQKVPATRTLTLHAAPQVLTLVLKRFSEVPGNKVDKAVHYPERLDMGQYLSQQSAGPRLYLLYAVLVHSGRTGNSGHYFCYVRAAGGQWFRMDDAEVTACDIASALSQRAYVLFYVLESEWERAGGEPRCLGNEHQGPRCSPWEPGRHPNFKGPGSEEQEQEALVEYISLEEWRRLQEQSRLQPEFHLRKVECTLPANAFVIHQSKFRGGGTNCLLSNPAGDILPQTLDNASDPRGRANANKRRKKGRRSVRVF